MQVQEQIVQQLRKKVKTMSLLKLVFRIYGRVRSPCAQHCEDAVTLSLNSRKKSAYSSTTEVLNSAWLPPAKVPRLQNQSLPSLIRPQDLLETTPQDWS